LTTGIAIICRYSSARLPGKILKEINGRTVLSYIVERAQKVAAETPIVVATSTDETDDPIAAYCQRVGLQVFRGDLDDVAGRLLACAQANKWDFVVRVNGDNLFLDSQNLAEMLAIARTAVFDFVSNVPGRTFPYGMSIEIVRTSFYREALAKMQEASHREHVTSWLYENPDFGKRYIHTNISCPEAAGMKLALDTQEDLEKATSILKHAVATQRVLGLREIFEFLNRNEAKSTWQGEAGPLLIAEIGGNHEGDFEIAKKMNALAIGSGADSVKFQLYRGDTLVSANENPNRNRHFKKFELTRDQHIYLAEMCREANVVYNASVWDMEMLEWIDPYLSFYKIGSGDMTAWPILAQFAAREKPILLSTGLSTLDEIMQTVNFIQRANPKYCEPAMLCVMQCTSMYPIPDRDANLCVMDAIRAHTDCTIGYSDHTIGMEALLTASAMGAQVLEFHFTDLREGKEFRDHKVSLVPEEVQELKQKISRITAFRGDGIKVPQPSELESKHKVSFRRGAYLNRAIKAGEQIKPEDIVCLRPAHGLDARDTNLLVGAKAVRNLEPYTALEINSDFIR
jgi:N-acetylneuraminate synthase/N,N'-diacetyllegionaminate synthase